MKVTVLSCTRRRDDRFLIVYRMPGAVTAFVVSDKAHPAGSSVVIRDGKAI